VIREPSTGRDSDAYRPLSVPSNALGLFVTWYRTSSRDSAVTHDPYDPPETRTFECVDCGHRLDDDHQPIGCPECDGDLQDLSVPRPQ
jgi:hypothetical protein